MNLRKDEGYAARLAAYRKEPVAKIAKPLRRIIAAHPPIKMPVRMGEVSDRYTVHPVVVWSLKLAAFGQGRALTAAARAL